MILVTSILSLILGVGLACAAEFVPTRIAAFESWGGTLLVTGLALLGAGAPMFR